MPFAENYFKPEDNVPWDNVQRQTLDVDGRPLMELMLSDEGPSVPYKKPMRRPLKQSGQEMVGDKVLSSIFDLRALTLSQ